MILLKHLKFAFEDFNHAELLMLANIAVKNIGCSLSEKASRLFPDYLMNKYINRDVLFTNAHLVESVITKAKLALMERVVTLSKGVPMDDTFLSTIEESDMNRALALSSENIEKPLLDYDAIKLVIAELDEMVGLEEVKKEVHKLTDVARFNQESGTASDNYYHRIFTGSPGVGKTHIARLYGKILKALGLLEQGHVVETDRAGLVAGHICQTAIKTAKVIESAMGGVLFIDEAYALAGHSQNDFGSEAIATLIKRMEDKRSKLVVIMAGYTNEMKLLVDSNPGIASRFNRTIHFDDYSTDELISIASFPSL